MRRSVYRSARRLSIPGSGNPRIINNQSVLQTTTIYLSAPAGSTVVVAWGDGNYSNLTADGSLKTLSHDYAATGIYFIEIFGDVDRIVDFRFYSTSFLSGQIKDVIRGMNNLSVFYCYATGLTGDLSEFEFCSNMTQINVNGNPPITGDLSSLSHLTGLTNLVTSSSSITGDLSDLNACTGMNQLRLNGASSVTGNMSFFSGRDMIFVDLYLTQVTGDIANLSDSAGGYSIVTAATPTTGDLSVIANFRADVNTQFQNNVGATLTYSSGTLPAFSGSHNMANCGLSTTEIDDLINDFAATAAGTGLRSLYLVGQTRSHASDAGYAALVALGWAVSVGGP